MKHTILASLALASLSAAASTVDFSYNATNETPYAYGFSKEQTYDAAIALNSPALAGTRILSVSVPVCNAQFASGAKVWLSAELSNPKGTGAPYVADIATYDVAINDGMITYTFSEPYTIPAEGVYVGYTLTVSGVAEGASGKPLAVVDGNARGDSGCAPTLRRSAGPTMPAATR